MKNLDDLINEMVGAEKQAQPSTHIIDEVMAGLTPRRRHIATTHHPVLRAVAIAASIAAVVIMGVQLGSSFVRSQSIPTDININDSQIENLHHYLIIGNE